MPLPPARKQSLSNQNNYTADDLGLAQQPKPTTLRRENFRVKKSAHVARKVRRQITLPDIHAPTNNLGSEIEVGNLENQNKVIGSEKIVGMSFLAQDSKDSL